MASPQELNALFTQFAGRNATRAELNFLSQFIDQGELSMFEAGEIIQGLPEARERQISQLSNQLGGILDSSNAAVLDQAQARIESFLNKQGRSGSSARTAAFARAAENLARDKARQIANFAAPALGQSFQQTVNQSAGSRGRGFAVRQDRLERARQLENFELQKNALQDQINSQGKLNLRSQLRGLAINAALPAVSSVGRKIVEGGLFSGGRPKPTGGGFRDLGSVGG